MAKFLRGLGKGLKAAGEGLSQLPSVFLKIEEEKNRALAEANRQKTQEAQLAEQIKAGQRQEIELQRGGVTALHDLTEKNLLEFKAPTEAWDSYSSMGDQLQVPDDQMLEEEAFREGYTDSFYNQLEQHIASLTEPKKMYAFQDLLPGLLARVAGPEPSPGRFTEAVTGRGPALMPPSSLADNLLTKGQRETREDGLQRPYSKQDEADILAYAEAQSQHVGGGPRGRGATQQMISAIENNLASDIEITRLTAKAQAEGASEGADMGKVNFMAATTEDQRNSLYEYLYLTTQAKNKYAQETAAMTASRPDLEFLMGRNKDLNDNHRKFFEPLSKLFSMLDAWDEHQAKMDPSLMSDDDFIAWTESQGLKGLFQGLGTSEGIEVARAEAASKGWNVTATGAFDLALINTFQRLIDVGVAVREGDILLIESAQRWHERVALRVKALLGGESRNLTDANRQAFRDIGMMLAKGSVEAYYVQYGQLEGQGERERYTGDLWFWDTWYPDTPLPDDLAKRMFSPDRLHEIRSHQGGWNYKTLGPEGAESDNTGTDEAALGRSESEDGR
jgi:hypothetical protein